MKKRAPEMQYKVNVYLGDKLIKKEDLHKLQIQSKTIDRIINDVIRRTDQQKGKAYEM